MPPVIETSRPVSAEDLSPGQFVALSRITYELIPDDPDSPWRQDLIPQRIRLMPCDAGRPLKVIAISVPFVLVRTPEGTPLTLDLRRVELMRLGAVFGREAYGRLRKAHRAPNRKCAR